MATILTFEKYLRTFHDWYEIDDNNKALIDLLSLYCARSKKFEATTDDHWLLDDQKKLYLDKGLCIIGNIGTGKTMLLKMINSFYGYMQGDLSLYRFMTANVTEVADNFSSKGRDVFFPMKKGNWFFDEMCFIDETTQKPDREFAINYGDKMLVGPKIIYDRYNVFIETGWQSHFTTNANIKQIRNVYGERVYSRLLEMCNIVILIGGDRRKNRRPVLPVNRNRTIIKKVDEVSTEQYNDTLPPNFNIEDEMEKAGLIREFQEYRVHRKSQYIEKTVYNRLVKFGVAVTNYKVYEPMYGELMGTMDNTLLENTCKVKAVSTFYDLLISQGKDSLEFPE